MTLITIRAGLPFVSVIIQANGEERRIEQILLDSGSAGTLFRTVDLEGMGVYLENTDCVVAMAGIGGQEFVVQKQIERIQIGDLIASPFVVQLGAVDYNFRVNGILGVDFLLAVGARIDFRNMTIG